MFSLASVMLDSGRADEARRFFRTAAEKGHLDAMYNYALMLERDGCREESLRDYKMAAATVRDGLNSIELKISNILIACILNKINFK